jgi:integrase
MIAEKPSKQKGKHGIASLESYRNRLRIHLPRAWYPGQSNKYLSLGLEDTPENREIAQRKLYWIQGELDQGTFDPTLERYQPTNKQGSYLKAVTDLRPQMTLIELWDSYVTYLVPVRKASTIHYLTTAITPKIKKCEFQSPYSAIEIRDWLLANTTASMTKRVLTQLNAAFKWGLKHKKLNNSASPFEGMAKEFKHRYEQESNPNAFTLEERENILKAFKNHKINGYSFSYYTPLVEFLFLTGCRPNEAIGLEWKDIDPDYRSITFNGGIYCANGKHLSSKGQGSKNNRIRKFPCNERLRELLRSLPKNHKLVFPSPKGTIINYNNFGKKPWHKVVDPIKPDTTPYSCRDTFITEQIAKGVGIAIVAKWVDDSAAVIERDYLDMTTIKHILPQ